ncbi:hypothetical protein GDO78_018298 [Eleutherodactylus coqui]|uniref:Uncharacterized protein n=1 Tax=Eleutherodactylus coqui TaxID=57060 RepID=A0A8J6EPH0_ELECQ|nr:hypothetical protein GDO78_018298 [Eleutherodactylus coqui]
MGEGGFDVAKNMYNPVYTATGVLAKISVLALMQNYSVISPLPYSSLSIPPPSSEPETTGFTVLLQDKLYIYLQNKHVIARAAGGAVQ